MLMIYIYTHEWMYNNVCIHIYIYQHLQRGAKWFRKGSHGKSIILIVFTRKHEIFMGYVSFREGKYKFDALFWHDFCHHFFPHVGDIHLTKAGKTPASFVIFTLSLVHGNQTNNAHPPALGHFCSNSAASPTTLGEDRHAPRRVFGNLS